MISSSLFSMLVMSVYSGVWVIDRVVQGSCVSCSSIYVKFCMVCVATSQSVDYSMFSRVSGVMISMIS